MKQNIKKCILVSVLVAFVALLTGILVCFLHMFYYSNDSTRKEDVEALATSEYQLLYLTMYSEEYASEYPFEHYLGWNTYKANHSFEKLTDVVDYVKVALEEQESVMQIVTLFDPAKVNRSFLYSSTLTQKAYQQILKECITAHPDINFVFLLPAYSLEYWAEKKEKQMKESLDSYLLFSNELKDLENVRIYFFGHCDWVIANPDNYEDSESCNEEIINRMIALSIYNDDYRVTGDVMGGYLEMLREKIVAEKGQDAQRDILEEYEIVFFGDSLIGNYGGTLSIPGVVKALSGAETYNCAIGGQTATQMLGEDSTPGFDVALSYFLDEQSDVFQEKEQFLQETARFKESKSDHKQLLFVISYGVNDYFCGKKVANAEDDYDISTYAGALNSGILRLRKAYPEAEILLVTPTFTQAFSCGREALSEEGGVLTDYVNAVKQVAISQNVWYCDSYIGLGMNEENCKQYLEDGVHLNEQGRFEYANFVIDCLRDSIPLH